MSTKYNISTKTFQLRTGPVAGYFLRSDATGNATWAQFPNTTFPNGTAAAPGIAFASDLMSGLYYSAGLIGLSISGVSKITFTATTITSTNGLTFRVGTTGTTSSLNVFGLITGNNGLTISAGLTSTQALTCTGLITANNGITSANGQTVNVGTSGTTSPLNVRGLMTSSGGISILGAVSSFTKTGSTTTSTGTIYVNPAAFTTGGTNLYYTYFEGPTVTTAAVTSAHTIFANAPVAIGTTITYPYTLYINGGITYLNSGMRYRVNVQGGNTYAALVTDSIIIMDNNTGGTKTVTLPVLIAGIVGLRLTISTRRARTVDINTASGANTFIGGGTTITILNGNGTRTVTAISTTQWSVG